MKPELNLSEMVKADRAERVKRCGDRINQVLKEERCILDVAITITLKGNLPQVRIIAED